jgi:hypothetical protein
MLTYADECARMQRRRRHQRHTALRQLRLRRCEQVLRRY